MSAAGAARIGVRVSLMLAVGLVILSGYGLSRGHLNITLPAAALFLVMSAQREKRQALSAVIAGWSGCVNDLAREKTLPVRWLAVGEDTKVYEAVMQLKPGFVHRIAVYDNDMRILDVVEERALIGQMMEDHSRMMRNLPRNVKKKIF